MTCALESAKTFQIRDQLFPEFPDPHLIIQSSQFILVSIIYDDKAASTQLVILPVSFPDCDSMLCRGIDM